MDYRSGPLGPMNLDGLAPETDVPYGLLLQLQEEYQQDDEEAVLGLFSTSEPSKKPVKKLAKKRKDPNAPKKAKSAYSFFMQERRGEIAEGHPDKSFGEISRLVSERWKDLPAEVKEEYEAKAREDKLRYQHAMATYEPPTDDNGPPKKRKRRKKDPAAPKKNSSAFLFFSQEMRPRIKQSQPELTTTQISEVLGRQWKSMSAEDRATYDHMARQDKLRYEREMAHWHATKHTRTANAVASQPPPPQPQVHHHHQTQHHQHQHSHQHHPSIHTTNAMVAQQRGNPVYIQPTPNSSLYPPLGPALLDDSL